MAKTRSSVFSIIVNGNKVELEIDEALKDKIVELVKEEYRKQDLRKNPERIAISDYYEISIRKIG